MKGADQEPPEQPSRLDRVALHRKKNRGHPLEEEVARELAREVGREVIEMDGMVVTLDAPLKDRSEQLWLAETFLELTSSPNGWWEEVLQEGVAKEERMVRWAEKAQAWLDERKRSAR